MSRCLWRSHVVPAVRTWACRAPDADPRNADRIRSPERTPTGADGMPEFRVVDLASQGGAVARHTKEWPKEEVLAWLGRYRRLCETYPYNGDVYVFHTPSELWTGFFLDGDNEFLPVGDHATYEPRLPSDCRIGLRWLPREVRGG